MFGRVWRSNILQHPICSNVSLKTCLCVLVCLCTFYIFFLVQIDGEVPKTYKTVFWLKMSGNDSLRTT